MHRKSKVVCSFLGLFLGFSGAHYFYIGRTLKGLLYLFTCGLFSFGWFYDIYLIVTGQFFEKYDLDSLSFQVSFSVTEKEVRHSKQDLHSLYRELPQKRVLKYNVNGTNPETGKKKTVYNVIVGSWQPFPAHIPGIEPPYEFTLDMCPITDAQIDLFRRNNVRIPPDISILDASAVISHIINDTEDSPHPYFEPPLPDEMLEEAVQKQVLLPSFLSKHEARLCLNGKCWEDDY